MEENEIGKVTHYYSKLGVGIIELSGVLSVGDTIRIHGATTELTQPIESMQVDYKDVKSAKKGDMVGIRVSQKVRDGDQVFKVI